mmetsp:Transcript_69335/g.184947  ORF Transcript_69335/g.184947 Transcript_69335/m.184947 type:complete len:132 (-) Transcript_69335:40-435(-)
MSMNSEFSFLSTCRHAALEEMASERPSSTGSIDSTPIIGPEQRVKKREILFSFFGGLLPSKPSTTEVEGKQSAHSDQGVDHRGLDFTFFAFQLRMTTLPMLQRHQSSPCPIQTTFRTCSSGLTPPALCSGN